MKIEKRQPDSDLESCFEYNGGDMTAFSFADIDDCLAAISGEHDGADYHWIVRLKDKRYGYITGDCDYTGWDCSSSGNNAAFDTLKEALDAVPEKEEYYNRGNLREHMKKQLDGKEAYGVITINHA